MPQQSTRDPIRISTDAPNMARVYNALLGGKDNFERDRRVVRQLAEIAPGVQQTGIEHRAWLTRVVHFLTQLRGIDQFLDCGSGLPSCENTHEVAQRANPDAHVCYVDNDPVVEAHSKVLLEEDERTRFVNADLTRPREVLDHPQVRRHLDLDRPLALVQAATVHHVHDDAEARAVMAEYVAALPSGSYVVLSHMFNPNDGGRIDQLCRILHESLAGTPGEVRYRTRDELDQLLAGTELLEPGWSPVHEWWPGGPRLDPVPDTNHMILGAVARKP